MFATGVSAGDNPFAGVNFAPMLPIRTPEMQSGDAPTITLKTEVPRAMFLIGSDQRSFRWLKKHGKRLRALNAVGLIVDVDNVHALRAMLSAGEGLVIVPTSGSDIAAALNLSVYPVLLEGDHAGP
ncbi:MAG TPA: integrating conjugative element protein [Woeseiaceae bacterium]|nr:integrating conjugative element protein [Woeseiaceae bacterium]